jgi:replicative DNA helicase
MNTNPAVTTIPHDLEAEQAVLGAIIANNDLVSEIANELTQNSFHSEPHRHIFRGILELDSEEKEINEIMLGDRLKQFSKLDEIGGYAYLAELVECAPHDANPIFFAKIIKEHAIARDIISICNDVGRKARDPQASIQSLITEGINGFFEISDRTIDQSEKTHIIDIIPQVIEDTERRAESNSVLEGLSTGFNKLDDLISGLVPGNLYVLAGRPGMGKSALATSIASNVGTKFSDGTIPIYSMEMGKKQNVRRMMASVGGINTRFFKTGKAPNEQEIWEKVYLSADAFSRSNIHVITKIKDIDRTINLTKSLHRKKPCVLVIFDYLQLMESGKKRSREEEVGSISKRLKWLAMELDIPVIAVAQLSRKVEERKDRRPVLSDLRDSGQIEQDADVIIFVYREDYYRKDEKNYVPDNQAEIIIAKHRDGPTGLVDLGFIPQYTRFHNLR